MLHPPNSSFDGFLKRRIVASAVLVRHSSTDQARAGMNEKAASLLLLLSLVAAAGTTSKSDTSTPNGSVHCNDVTALVSAPTTLACERATGFSLVSASSLPSADQMTKICVTPECIEYLEAVRTSMRPLECAGSKNATIRAVLDAINCNEQVPISTEVWSARDDTMRLRAPAHVGYRALAAASSTSTSSTTNAPSKPGGTVVIIGAIVAVVGAAIAVTGCAAMCSSNEDGVRPNNPPYHAVLSPLEARQQRLAGGQEPQLDAWTLLEQSPLLVQKRFTRDQLDLCEQLAVTQVATVWVSEFKGEFVALKYLLRVKEQEQAIIDAFAQEIILSASLKHPCLVGCIGAHWKRGVRLAMVMELAENGDLESCLKDPVLTMTWSTHKLHIAVQVAQGLQYLHKQTTPIIHRDLRAKNVLVTATMNAKLCGFGRSATDSRPVGVDSLFWVAPEVIVSSAPSHAQACDIYAFGVFLSELDTHRAPYLDLVSEGKQPVHIAHMVGQGQLQPSFLPSCPPGVLDIAQMCLKTDPEQRPSAEIVVLMLEDLMSMPAECDTKNPSPNVPTKQHRSTNAVVVPMTTLSVLEADPVVRMTRISLDELDFQPDNLISCGAFGEVWKSNYRGTMVAVKRVPMNRRSDEKSIKLFAAEIVLAGSLLHPNVVRFIGAAWTGPEDLCLVMEFHEKGDLQSYLQRHRSMISWFPQKLSIAVDVARGLQFLHERAPPIIHRDLKAKNVLLSDSMSAKLIDFGISRECVDVTMTADMGTSYWIAREVLNGESYNESSDMYSFGVVLSELDTCETPFKSLRDKGKSQMQIMSMVFQGSVQLDFTPMCPPQVLKLARCCLSDDPKLRPSAKQAVQILEEILHASAA